MHHKAFEARPNPLGERTELPDPLAGFKGLAVLLSSRPWSWSRVVSRPNLPVLVLVLVLLLNKTKTLLISTVRSQPQSCDYYTSLRPTVPVSTMHASLDFMQSWNCICLYQRHLHRLKGCSATVAYL